MAFAPQIVLVLVVARIVELGPLLVKSGSFGEVDNHPPGPHFGFSNLFYLIEANETFAVTFYFWYFLLRIDSEALFSQKCCLTPNSARKPSDQSSAGIDDPPVRALVA